ncbi:MAG: MFS transporter [Actinomycetes bacterium]
MPAEPQRRSDQVGGVPVVADTGGTGGVQRHNLRVLLASQVLGGVGVASGVAVGALLAERLSGSTALAGLTQTGTVLRAALLAVPLARLAARSGRRHALSAGYLVGLAGAVLTVLAAVLGWFWLMLVGSVLFGGGTASNLQARYAATDGATDADRGRALSVVVWATTVGAVAGPNLAGVGGRTAQLVGLPPLSGPFVYSIVSFAAGAAVVAVALRALRRPGAPESASADEGRSVSTMTVLAIVARRPRARLAMAAIAGAHAVMVGVMVMTPVHLGHGGASLEVVGIVISLHITGMYAASPAMGWLTDRVGRVRTIGIGVAVLLLALVLAATSPGAMGAEAMKAGAAMGTAPVQVAVALTVLGLGWSCCVVAGSTLLSESVPADVRIPAQGTSDLVMGLSAAAAGALAGPVLAATGFGWLSGLAALLLLPVLALAVPLLRTARSRAAVG